VVAYRRRQAVEKPTDGVVPTRMTLGAQQGGGVAIELGDQRPGAEWAEKCLADSLDDLYRAVTSGSTEAAAVEKPSARPPGKERMRKSVIQSSRTTGSVPANERKAISALTARKASVRATGNGVATLFAMIPGPRKVKFHDARIRAIFSAS
jgi:hypothetical protein